MIKVHTLKLRSFFKILFRMTRIGSGFNKLNIILKTIINLEKKVVFKTIREICRSRSRKSLNGSEVGSFPVINLDLGQYNVLFSFRGVYISIAGQMYWKHRFMSSSCDSITVVLFPEDMQPAIVVGCGWP